MKEITVKFTEEELNIVSNVMIDFMKRVREAKKLVAYDDNSACAIEKHLNNLRGIHLKICDAMN